MYLLFILSMYSFIHLFVYFDFFSSSFIRSSIYLFVLFVYLFIQYMNWWYVCTFSFTSAVEGPGQQGSAETGRPERGRQHSNQSARRQGMWELCLTIMVISIWQKQYLENIWRRTVLQNFRGD